MNKSKTFDGTFWWCLLAFAVFVGFICSLPSLLTQHSEEFDFTGTGQIGDTIGGIMGPFIAIAASILTFLAFWIQFKANEQQRADLKHQRERANLDAFENTFFEMIRLHRENVSELNYTKFNGEKFETANNRKVFRVIFNEFIECYREVQKFSRDKKHSSFLTPKYKKYLERVVKVYNLRVDVEQLAIIDITYSIVFFGIGKEGETVLRARFLKKYNNVYFYRLLTYLKLKPKKENKEAFKLWEYLKTLELKTLHPIVEEVYINREHVKQKHAVPDMVKNLFNNYKLDKYYGGHQHRLGHYFRHLFQSYKFLNNSEIVSRDQKYLYGKTLRAQLSTYEQALLFINSISSLGMKWEYTPDLELNGSESKEEIFSIREDNRLITKYNLIKNLPGGHFSGIEYKRYYPGVRFETDEDQYS